MSNIDKEKIDAEGYENFKKNVLEQLPNPYFCQKEEEKYFLGLKLEYPGVTKYVNTGMGTAICLDNNARMNLAYRMMEDSRAFAYIVECVMKDSFNAEVEGVFSS
jgi:hypothetical protein